MWYCAGEWGNALLRSGMVSGVGLSSLELLNVKQWCTELWLLNLLEECSRWCAAVINNLVGSKEIFSLVEMWYRHGAFCRGVGMFKLSLPLSYPSSSCASCYWKVSVKVVMEWLNSTSFDMFLNCCAELLLKKAVYYSLCSITEGVRFEIFCPKF